MGMLYVKKHSPGEVSLVEPSYQVRTTEVSHVHEMPRLDLGMTLGGMTVTLLNIQKSSTPSGNDLFVNFTKSKYKVKSIHFSNAKRTFTETYILYM